ncbi:substrate-binding periplasmic protein [Acidomonas methanolica]|uniref:Extracellular solute-binding protein n=2 Tax=Acidomonas methanolica TaxID=437 RepID=A0A023D1V0_ACIMT|nr:transporter substrate-binding domain-containing protein [Acidomonas methanolica]MBU2654530.1 transporter substrate-binding domain-containing protein [Acidomonas methanolica]TCS27402.1 amino acid ABC transporter substrate-binding protein (PAAT family) [Acidomonas methanolica]GAJ28117.1 extracellular solute-binding protein [Acidomonas methanolica NBRC 104435]GEK98691.1 hypothetical protein AME01nite_11900 [Acidomonas methanolica NBRC 104435]
MRAARTPFLLASLCAALTLHPASAADGYGRCALFGHRATGHIEPAIPGQLTVLVNLPAVGEFDGETPETIRSGREFCMAVNLAYRLGLDRVVLRNTTLDSLIAGRNRGYDLALALLSVRHRKRDVVTFSVPYARDSYGVAVRAGRPADPTRLRSMRVATQIEANVPDWLRDTLHIRRLSAFDDTGTMFTALAAGNVDAVVTSLSVILGQVGAAHGRFVVAGRFADGRPLAAILPLGSAEAPEIDRLLDAMRDDGTLAALETAYLAPSWHGIDPTEIPLWR